MSHTVVKPFKSLNRKFKAGSSVSPADIDPNGAVSFEDWIARGFIKREGGVELPLAKRPGGRSPSATQAKAPAE